jgi:hypothetical protein
MLARYRRDQSSLDSQKIEFLEDEDAREPRAALTSQQAAITTEAARHEAAEQQQRDLTAWWVNRHRS